jgi:hypothetical protein
MFFLLHGLSHYYFFTCLSRNSCILAPFSIVFCWCCHFYSFKTNTSFCQMYGWRHQMTSKVVATLLKTLLLGKKKHAVLIMQIKTDFISQLDMSYHIVKVSNCTKKGVSVILWCCFSLFKCQWPPLIQGALPFLPQIVDIFIHVQKRISFRAHPLVKA